MKTKGKNWLGWKWEKTELEIKGTPADVKRMWRIEDGEWTASNKPRIKFIIPEEYRKGKEL